MAAPIDPKNPLQWIDIDEIIRRLSKEGEPLEGDVLAQERLKDYLMSNDFDGDGVLSHAELHDIVDDPEFVSFELVEDGIFLDNVVGAGSRDRAFRRIFNMFGETSAAYDARVCENPSQAETDAPIDMPAPLADAEWQNQLTELVNLWGEGFDGSGIPMRELKEISPHLTMVDGKLVAKESFFEIQPSEADATHARMSVALLRQTFEKAAAAETDPILKCYYAGQAALYNGDVLSAKFNLKKFDVCMIPSNAAEAEMKRRGSQILAALEIASLNTMREQNEERYAELMVRPTRASEAESYYESNVVLFDELENVIASGAANTIEDAMVFLQTQHEFALQNEDVGIEVRRGWTVKNPFPRPKTGSDELERWERATRDIAGIPSQDPSKVNHIDIPQITLRGGIVEFPDGTYNMPGVRIDVGPEGGYIQVGPERLYTFPPYPGERVVYLSGITLFAGDLEEGRHYENDQKLHVPIPRVFGPGAVRDPIMESLFALNTFPAWQIAQEDEGKKLLMDMAIQDMNTYEGSHQIPARLCEEVLTEHFDDVLERIADSDDVKDLEEEFYSESNTKKLRKMVEAELDTFAKKDPFGFESLYPDGIVPEAVIFRMVEDRRANALMGAIGSLAWGRLVYEARMGALNLNASESLALEQLNTILGLDDLAAFEISDQATTALADMFIEELLWSLPTAGISLGAGSLVRSGLRRIDEVRQVMAKGGTAARRLEAGIQVFSFYAVEGTLQEIQNNMLMGVMDWPDIYNIAYYGTLNAAFHVGGMAGNKLFDRIGLSATNIQRTSGWHRKRLQAERFVGTMAVQATLMTPVTMWEEGQHSLHDDSGFAERWAVSFFRSAAGHGWTKLADGGSKRLFGVSFLEMEQRSIMRNTEAQRIYAQLQRHRPQMSDDLKVLTAMTEADYLVPSAASGLFPQRRPTAEQYAEMRRLGLRPLIDRWNGTARKSADGFLQLVDDYQEAHDDLAVVTAETDRTDVLRRLDNLDDVALVAVGQAKGIFTQDANSPQTGYGRGVDMAWAARRGEPGAPEQIYSAAFVMNMTQANNVSKTGATNLKWGLSTLMREFFGDSPMMYAAAYADQPGQTSISNHTIMHIQVDSTSQIPGFMRDLPGHMDQMVRDHYKMLPDAERAVKKAQAKRNQALADHGQDSNEYRRANRDFLTAKGQLERVTAITKNFRVHNGKVQVLGDGGQYFDLAEFDLDLNGAIEAYNMDRILEADKPSYVHQEVQRARNAAIDKVEFIYGQNRDTTTALAVRDRMAGIDFQVPQEANHRYLFPAGQHLSRDDITQNVLRLYYNVTEHSGAEGSTGLRSEFVRKVVQDVLKVRAAYHIAESRELPYSQREIHAAFERADKRLRELETRHFRDIARIRGEELAALGGDDGPGIDYTECLSLAKQWDLGLNGAGEPLRQLAYAPEAEGGHQEALFEWHSSPDARHSRVDMDYHRDVTFDDLASFHGAQEAVLQLERAFNGPLMPTGIILYHEMGGIVEPSRMLRNMYSGRPGKGSFFERAEFLRKKLRENPDGKLGEEDLKLVEDILAANRRTMRLVQGAAFDNRDRVTRPWAIFSQATARTMQRHYRELDAFGVTLEGGDVRGMYEFGIEVGHAKDRENQVSPWDDSFFKEPTMLPIRQLNQMVADRLSHERGATVVIESYAMGDEMVARFAMHDSNGKRIDPADIETAYRETLAEMFPQEFHYTKKVVTRLASPELPSQVARKPMYTMDTPYGKYTVADASGPDEPALTRFYVIDGPDVKKPDPDAGEMYEAIHAEAFERQVGVDADYVADLEVPLYQPVMGPLELRLAGAQMVFQNSAILGNQAMSESPEYMGYLEQSALEAMGYDEVIKQREAPTKGIHWRETERLQNEFASKRGMLRYVVPPEQIDYVPFNNSILLDQSPTP